MESPVPALQTLQVERPIRTGQGTVLYGPALLKSQGIEVTTSDNSIGDVFGHPSGDSGSITDDLHQTVNLGLLLLLRDVLEGYSPSEGVHASVGV